MHAYDVPVTFSVAADSAAEAEEHVRNILAQHNERVSYERDHAFIDGCTHKCDCNGH